MSRAGGVFARLVDALYAASDASHRERGWEVRRGAFGARRYRLDVRAWLEAQRDAEAFGSVPAPVVAGLPHDSEQLAGSAMSKDVA